MKPTDEMTEEELIQFLKNRGFEDDEIAVSFKGEAALRSAVDDMRKLQDGDDEADDKLGFDSEDNTELTTDQKREVSLRDKTRENRLNALKDIEAKRKGVQLEKSIEEAGNLVKPEEVQKTMAEIGKLLSED